MQDKLEETFFDWIVSIWPDDKILAICLALTGFCLVWALAEKTGFIFDWMPKRKLLAEALQTTITGPLGNNKVDVGLEYQDRLQRIANGQSGVSGSINFTQNLLGRFYHPTPLHREALLKAMNYALVYSLLFWLLPWLTKFGEAFLLPNNPELSECIIVLKPVLPFLIYYWLKDNFTLTSWRDTATKAISILCSFSLISTTNYYGNIALAVAVAGTFFTTGTFAGTVAGTAVSVITYIFAVVITISFAIPFLFAGAFLFAVVIAVTVAIASAVYYLITFNH